MYEKNKSSNNAHLIFLELIFKILEIPKLVLLKKINVILSLLLPPILPPLPPTYHQNWFLAGVYHNKALSGLGSQSCFEKSQFRKLELKAYRSTYFELF